MADVMNRNNPYAATRAALKDDHLPLRQSAVVWASAAVRAVLDLAILLLMLFALTAVFDLVQGEPGASLAASAGGVAGMASVVWLRRFFVAPDDETPAQDRRRSPR